MITSIKALAFASYNTATGKGKNRKMQLVQEKEPFMIKEILSDDPEHIVREIQNMDMDMEDSLRMPDKIAMHFWVEFE
jgi:hypothetical protein